MKDLIKFLTDWQRSGVSREWNVCGFGNEVHVRMSNEQELLEHSLTLRCLEKHTNGLSGPVVDSVECLIEKLGE